MFDGFYGNHTTQGTLELMIERERIPQTILISGPEGVGKATLVRRFAARVLGGAEKIEHDDLSLTHNADVIADREKWPAEKRNEDPLMFATHPDFVSFAPDGPLRQLTIPQMRSLKEQAQFKPLKGQRRVFLIDQIDRANEQAANSLLKTLEEPPEHLIVFMTASNPYDLLPTIRSRAVPLQLGPLSAEEMREFAKVRQMDNPERRVALARGSPGLALSIDLELYDRRRDAMLTLLEVAAGIAPFGAWVRYAESGSSRSEKLDPLLRSLYGLLEDVLVLHEGGSDVRNIDVRKQLDTLARKVSFAWIRKAVAKADELAELVRRNIQKNIALDALIVELRT